MSQHPIIIEPPPWNITVESVRLTDGDFERLCRDNPELKLELTAEGELEIMTPTGVSTGARNSEITYQLAHWTKQNGTGVCFDSSTMFTLENGAKRSPDASWISREKYFELSEREKDSFAHVTPDFVIELRSPTDGLRAIKTKMREYISVGVTLGWLIDPTERRVYVYRPKRKVLVMNNADAVKGDPVLPGFKLDLREIW